jgi:hypothetical protein
MLRARAVLKVMLQPDAGAATASLPRSNREHVSTR